MLEKGKINKANIGSWIAIVQLIQLAAPMVVELLEAIGGLFDGDEDE